MAEDVQGERHERPGLDGPGVDRPGPDQPGFDQPGLERPALERSGVGRVRRRVVVALAMGAVVAAIVVPVMVAGQQQRSEAPAAAEAPSASAVVPSATPFIEGQPPSLPPLDQHPEPSYPAPTGDVVKGRPSVDGCPADARQLLASLRGSDVLERRAAPRDLAEIDCYGGYAVARTELSEKDSATVIFRYLEMTDSWRAVDADETAVCDGVPKDVRVHLQPCR